MSVLSDLILYGQVILFISFLGILPVFLYADTYVRGMTHVAFVTEYILENYISVELGCPHSAKVSLCL